MTGDVSSVPSIPAPVWAPGISSIGPAAIGPATTGPPALYLYCYTRHTHTSRNRSYILLPKFVRLPRTFRRWSLTSSQLRLRHRRETPEPTPTPTTVPHFAESLYVDKKRVDKKSR